jgi:hypothetical protein
MSRKRAYTEYFKTATQLGFRLHTDYFKCPRKKKKATKRDVERSGYYDRKKKKVYRVYVRTRPLPLGILKIVSNCQDYIPAAYPCVVRPFPNPGNSSIKDPKAPDSLPI